MIDLEAKQIFNFYLIILINDDPDEERPKCRLFKGFTSGPIKTSALIWQIYDPKCTAEPVI